MRYSRKVDTNQPAIFAGLRAAGFSVLDTSKIGGGFPDAIVAALGAIVLLEIKNPETRGKLNKRQKAWHAAAQAPVVIAYTVEEAIEKVTADAKRQLGLRDEAALEAIGAVSLARGDARS